MRGATPTGAQASVAPTIIALIVLWAAALADQVWIFAVLFIGWAMFDVVNGESHFIQRIVRREHPVVFWLLVGSWVTLSILWIMAG